ncbi:MAG: hypothetical protein AAF677_01600 [Pseudomonadota bacterium]
MTAEDQGQSALDLALALGRKIRRFWLIASFAVGGLLWALDVLRVYAPLPETVAGMDRRIERLEAAAERADAPPEAGPDAAGTGPAARPRGAPGAERGWPVCPENGPGRPPATLLHIGERRSNAP